MWLISGTGNGESQAAILSSGTSAITFHDVLKTGHEIAQGKWSPGNKASGFVSGYMAALRKRILRKIRVPKGRKEHFGKLSDCKKKTCNYFSIRARNTLVAVVGWKEVAAFLSPDLWQRSCVDTGNKSKSLLVAKPTLNLFWGVSFWSLIWIRSRTKPRRILPDSEASDILNIINSAGVLTRQPFLGGWVRARARAPKRVPKKTLWGARARARTQPRKSLKFSHWIKAQGSFRNTLELEDNDVALVKQASFHDVLTVIKCKRLAAGGRSDTSPSTPRNSKCESRPGARRWEVLPSAKQKWHLIGLLAQACGDFGWDAAWRHGIRRKGLKAFENFS